MTKRPQFVLSNVFSQQQGIIYLVRTYNFSKNQHFLPPDKPTYACVSGGRTVSFSKHFGYALNELSLIKEMCLGTSQTSMIELFTKIVRGSQQKDPSQMLDRFLNTRQTVIYSCIQKGKNCTNIDSICLPDQYCQDSCTEHYECGESLVQPFIDRVSLLFWLLFCKL